MTRRSTSCSWQEMIGGIDNVVVDNVPIAAGVPLELLALGICVPVVIAGTVVWTRRRGA